MKILFAATRSWPDLAAVAKILDSIAGDGPVHVVLGYETRGPEAYVPEWARQRAKLRRTAIDVLTAGKQYGPDRSQWRARRDAHMVKLGGYDIAVILKHSGREQSTRLDDLADLARGAGIPVMMVDYRKGAAQ